MASISDKINIVKMDILIKFTFLVTLNFGKKNKKNITLVAGF